MIPSQDLLAYLGKFIHSVFKRQHCNSYFKACRSNFPNHFKKHTWEISRINDFTTAIFFISTPARDKAGGTKSNSQQKKRNSGTWHNWKNLHSSRLVLWINFKCWKITCLPSCGFTFWLCTHIYRCFIYKLLLHYYCEYYIYIMLELSQGILASTTDILLVSEKKKQSAFLNIPFYAITTLWVFRVGCF